MPSMLSSVSRPRASQLILGVCAVIGLSTSQAMRLPLGFTPPSPAAPVQAPPCSAPTDALNLAVWQVVKAAGQTDLSCANLFVEYQRTPRSAQTPADAFDQIAAQIRGAKAEVLLTNMEWDSGQGNPGWTFAEAVRDLYAKVKADPAAYPSGMTVRLVLGGYPKNGQPDDPNYVLYVVKDLRALNVPLTDPQVGWHMALATYPYFPHSHVKLHVIDGQDVTVAGYNFSNWHLPTNEAGGRDLHDLGLRMTGPVAQAGAAVFDDLWKLSEQVDCPPNIAAALVTTSCHLVKSETIRHPQAVTAALATGPSRAYLLYRRPGYPMADQALLALMDAATSEIDLMEADFGPNVQCWLAYLSPDDCQSDTFPVYMTALLRAMERGVRVRVLTVNYGFGQAANRSGVALMRFEAKRRGLAELFDARYVNAKMHTKALLIDQKMVVVGSMNFHFSSWGAFGLNEAVLATDDPLAIAEQTQSFGDMWQHQSQAVPDEWWLGRIERLDPAKEFPPAEPKETRGSIRN